MSTYIVGDIQGCLASLQCLLERVQFNPSNDVLYCVGDLVNRGPDSLGTLRFIKALQEKNAAQIVLGNHDLHLIAIYYGVKSCKPDSDLAEIIQAADADELIQWLRQQPLAHLNTEHNMLMTHAGLPPIWSPHQARQFANEVEFALKDEQLCRQFLQAMYGDEPHTWSDTLTGMERLRVITNYLTRMRFCTAAGELDFVSKGDPLSPPAGFSPWFQFNNPALDNTQVIFGHWAALMGKTNNAQFIALDTGCVWGGHMTLYRLEDQSTFTCDCPE